MYTFHSTRRWCDEQTDDALKIFYRSSQDGQSVND